MRADHRRNLSAAHIFKDCACKGGAFRRVCPGAELIKKHEVIFSGRPYDIRDIFHMAAEGGQRFLYGLGIPNVGVDLMKYGKGAAFSGHEKPGLRHQHEQPEGL